MVQTTQITKTEMLELYANGEGSEFLNTGNRIYARTTKAQALNPAGYIIVWCVI